MTRTAIATGLTALGSVLAMTASPILMGAQGKPGEPAATLGIGRPATPAEIAALDIDVGPDGAGLPPGKGSAAHGALVYAARCAACHGQSGREGPNDVLVAPALTSGFSFAQNAKLPRAIGNYWPYATTLFDYIRRAMPPDAPGSLSDDDVYALVAHLLAWNQIVAADAVMDATSLPKVRMPARDYFVPAARGTAKPKP
jgi:S-disulfanyl-L-cysteine oxidoreductase SoxD